MPTLEDAMVYIGQGISVTATSKGVRHPVGRWSDLQDHLATQPQLEAAFEAMPGGNIVMICGKLSGISVIDVDGQEGFNNLIASGIALPATKSIKSPHGWHLYYKYNPNLKTGLASIKKVDIKSDGGCVCVPPSVVPDGAYTVLRDYELGELSDDLVAKLNFAKVQRETGQLEYWWAKLFEEGSHSGARNADGARLAGYLHSKDLPVDVMRAILGAWGERCTPPMNPKEIETIARSVKRYWTPTVVSIDEEYKDEV